MNHRPAETPARSFTPAHKAIITSLTVTLKRALCFDVISAKPRQQRGEDLDAFIEKINQLLIGPGGTPVFSAHQMCSAKLGRDSQTSAAKTSGELHEVTGVWIADASGMPSCSGVNPMMSTMALARRTAMNMLDQEGS
jgi:choline dehydrogenase-like flavoprotein